MTKRSTSSTHKALALYDQTHRGALAACPSLAADRRPPILTTGYPMTWMMPTQQLTLVRLPAS